MDSCATCAAHIPHEEKRLDSSTEEHGCSSPWRQHTGQHDTITQQPRAAAANSHMTMLLVLIATTALFLHHCITAHAAVPQVCPAQARSPPSPSCRVNLDSSGNNKRTAATPA